MVSLHAGWPAGPLLFPPSVLPPLRGPERVSLHSFLRLICEANQLLLVDVVSAFSAPLFGESPERSRKLVKSVHLIDAGSVQSGRMIEFLEACTGMHGLDALTLKGLALSGLSDLATRPFRKWCSHCYQADVQAGLSPYDRLLWSINLVRYCPVHEIKLSSKCLCCMKDRSPTLYGRDISGFCPKCQAWLGKAEVPRWGQHDDQSRHGIWVARSFADLLEFELPVEEHLGGSLVASIRELAELHHKGVMARLAEQVRRNKSVVATWLAGKSRPNWDALCDLSYVYQQPLHALLTGEIAKISLDQPLLLPASALPRQGTRKRAQVLDSTKAVLLLEAASSGAYKSMGSVRDVAKRLGTSDRELLRRVPDATRAAAEAFRQLRKAASAEAACRRVEGLSKAAALVAKEFASQGSKVTRRTMAKAMEKLGWAPRYNESAALLSFVKQAVARRSANGPAGSPSCSGES